MEKIIVQGIEYNIRQTIDDLTFGEYCRLIQITTRRERVLDMTTNDGEEIWEDVEVGKESQLFLDKKEIDFLSIITEIPTELYEEFPQLKEIIFNETGDLFADDSEPMEFITLNGVDYTYPELIDWTFQEWCDMEGAVQMIKDHTIIFPLTTIIRQAGRRYNRFHPDFQGKRQMLEALPAKGLVATVMQIINEMKPMREAHPYIYKASYGEDAGRYLKQHLEVVKWEDTIVQLAQSNVFNSPSGTLNGVRIANVLEVLQYLNVKKGRDMAEYLDSKKQNLILNGHQES